MSENKKRTVAEIQSEYQSGCLKAGHINYQIYTLGRDLELLNSTLRDLNLEAASAQAAEKAQETPAVEEVKE